MGSRKRFRIFTTAVAHLTMAVMALNSHTTVRGKLSKCTFQNVIYSGTFLKYICVHPSVASSKHYSSPISVTNRAIVENCVFATYGKHFHE